MAHQHIDYMRKQRTIHQYKNKAQSENDVIKTETVEQDGTKTITKTVVENHNWKLVDYTIVTTASVLLVLLILYAIKRISKLFKGSDKSE